VRIDESKMTVFALTAKGEAKIPLNAIGKDEVYIKEVKALFSTHVMGSPGGYPVYLKRWTRMGQAAMTVWRSYYCWVNRKRWSLRCTPRD